MPKPPRAYRFAEKVREAISTELLQISDPRLDFVTITSVVVTPDVKEAKVYWSVFVDESKSLKRKIKDVDQAFLASRGYFRNILAKKLEARTVPQLKFFYDDTFEQKDQIDSLMGKVEAKENRLNRQSDVNEVADRILEAENILILSHAYPDADAYGSSLALSLALNKLGKNTINVNANGQMPFYTFIRGIDSVQDSIPNEPFDLAITCDCSNLSRLDFRIENEVKASCQDVDLINIDHHYASNDYFADYNWVERHTSSTAEMVFYLIKELNIPFDQDIAINLASGIYSDTVSLQRGNVGEKTFSALAELSRHIEDFAEFINPLYWSKSEKLLKLEAEVIKTMTFHNEGRYAEILIEPEQFSDSTELYPFKDLPLKIASVEVCSLIRYEDGLWKVSLRSKGGVDVNLLAQNLGGGGHAGAAGIKWRESLDELLAQLRANITTSLSQ